MRENRANFGKMTHPIRNRWAFLVGINQYRDSAYGELKYCVNDVTTLQALLKQVGYAAVVCLHDKLEPRSARFPNRKNIADELQQLTQKVGPDDLLLVYFACHGTRAGDGKPRLIAEDTRAYNLPNQALAVADVEDWMRGSGAERLVLMLDACHIGVGTDQRNMADPEFIRNVHELATGFALLAASTDQQSAYELGGLRHGVLSYYLLRGLAGEAEKENAELVTVRSLQEYVLNELKKRSVADGFWQDPMGRADGNLGDMILVDWRDGTRPVLALGSPDKGTTDRDGQRQQRTEASDDPSSAATGNIPSRPSSLKLARLQDTRRIKFEDYERESALLGTMKGGDDNSLNRRLSNLEDEIEQLDQQISAIERGLGG